MAKALGISNLSFNDDTRKDDYLLTFEGSDIPRKFNLPLDTSCQRMYPSTKTEFICDDESMESMYYNTEEMDKLLDDLSYDIKLHVADMFSVASIPTSTIKNDDQLFMQIVNREQ